MNRKIQPIFLISLPRSGSTLLQKMLMAHKNIASHAEPWFLLPLMYSMKEDGIKTEYGQIQAHMAIRDIYKSLPRGKEDYQEEIQNFALNIYTKIAGDESFFVDKTPRYFLILDELHSTFPNAKFIYLFRNPVSVYASMIEAFRDNKMWRTDHLDNDLYLGPKKISESYEKNKDNSFFICYEDLIDEPVDSLMKLCHYLSIDYDSSMVTDFTNQKIEGFGDAIGARKYKEIRNNKNKWKKIINTIYRKQRLKGYIKQVDDKYLEIGGYNRESILLEIKKLRTKFIFKEYVYCVEEFITRLIKKIINFKSLR